MPRISEDHREGQRQRFLTAVRRCAAEHGLAATSMDDIRRSAGASAGAMYRYFDSKDQLVRAAVTESMAAVEALVEEVAESGHGQDPTAFLTELLGRLEQFARRDPAVNLFKVAIQGWAFSQQDDETARIVAASSARQHSIIVRAAASWSTPPRDRPSLATAITCAMVGYVTQRALLDRADPRQLVAGLAAFSLSTSSTRPSRG